MGRTEHGGLSLCSCCAPAWQGLRRCASLRAQEDVCPPGGWFPPFYDRNAAEAEHIFLRYRVSVLPLPTASAGDGEYHPQQCARRGNPPRGILCTLNEPWPTPQPFFLPCRNSFPRSTRGLTHQTLFIWDPKSAITEAELRIAPTRGLFHIYRVFSYLYRKCYLITSVYLSHWKGKLHERVKSQLQRKQQKPAEVRGNRTSQKGPCGNIPCSSRGRHHEETW